MPCLQCRTNRRSYRLLFRMTACLWLSSASERPLAGPDGGLPPLDLTLAGPRCRSSPAAAPMGFEAASSAIGPGVGLAHPCAALFALCHPLFTSPAGCDPVPGHLRARLAHALPNTSARIPLHHSLYRFTHKDSSRLRASFLPFCCCSIDVRS